MSNSMPNTSSPRPILDVAAGLDLAPKLGWHLINMKNDWKVIFPFELK